MSVKTKLRLISVEEYLAGELVSDIKHELVGGQAYAMVGVSRRHSLIAGALYAALHNRLRGGPCQAHISDFKVRIDDIFYYPDVLVSCGAGGHDYYETAPVLIVEVLSPSTENRDRMEKRFTYQRLDSLKEYVLIAQDNMLAEVHRRIEGGWEIECFDEHDDLRLESVDLSVPMAEIYQDVMSTP